MSPRYQYDISHKKEPLKPGTKAHNLSLRVQTVVHIVLYTSICFLCSTYIYIYTVGDHFAAVELAHHAGDAVVPITRWGTSSGRPHTAHGLRGCDFHREHSADQHGSSSRGQAAPVVAGARGMMR